MRSVHDGLIRDAPQRGANVKLDVLQSPHRPKMSRKIPTRTRTESSGNDRKLLEIARMYDVTAERNRVKAELERVARKERLLDRKLIADYKANHKTINRRHLEYIPRVLIAEQYLDASSPYRMAVNATLAAARSNNPNSSAASLQVTRNVDRRLPTPSSSRRATDGDYGSSGRLSDFDSGSRLQTLVATASEESIRREDVAAVKVVDFRHADARVVTTITRPARHGLHLKAKTINAVREDINQVIPSINRLAPLQHSPILPRDNETSVARMKYIRDKRLRALRAPGDRDQHGKHDIDEDDAASTSELNARVTYVRLVGGKTVKQVVDVGGVSISYGAKSPTERESAVLADGERLAQDAHGQTGIYDSLSTGDDSAADRSAANLPDEIDDKYTLRRFLGYQRAMARRAAAVAAAGTVKNTTDNDKDVGIDAMRSDSNSRLSETVEWVLAKAGLSKLRSVGSSRHDDTIAANSTGNARDVERIASQPSDVQSTKKAASSSGGGRTVDVAYAPSGRQSRLSGGRAYVRFGKDEEQQTTMTYERETTDSDPNGGTTYDVVNLPEADGTNDDTRSGSMRSHGDLVSSTTEKSQRTDPEEASSGESDSAVSRLTSDDNLESRSMSPKVEAPLVADFGNDTESGYALEDRLMMVPRTKPLDSLDERDEFQEPPI